MTTTELLALMREREAQILLMLQREHETEIAAMFQQATTEAELEQAALFRAVLDNLTTNKTFTTE